MLDLQTIAHNAGHQVPLLIAIDQENGGVNSLYDEANIRQFPSAMAMAAAGSKKLARDISRATAQELNACGVNWILGPVLDVLTNARTQPLGVRSIGDDPQEVSSYGMECMKGFQEGGTATCGKHFPSYGNLEFFGSPQDVPTITDSLERLSQNALIPFKNAIVNGIDAMMVGGVAVATSSVNAMHACLSEQIVRDLLRHQLQFDGVVISECLEMEALSRNIGISGGAVMAFNAGCDLLLTCRNLSVQQEAINGLKAGLDNGMIERFRVQESVQRVLQMKQRYTSWEKAFSPGGVDALMTLQPLHSALSTTAYNQSITIVRDQNHNIPLTNIVAPDQEILLLTPLLKPLPASAAYRQPDEAIGMPNVEHIHAFDRKNSIMSGEQVFREFGRSLARQRTGKVSHTSYTANGVRPTHENLLNRAQAVIVVTADAGRNLYQNGFAKHISMLCKLSIDSRGTPREKPCVVVSVSSPFDFAADSSVGTYVCTYDFTETALQALTRVLYGHVIASGILPGSSSHSSKTSHARQQWLVESYNEEKDAAALDSLLAQVQNEPEINTSNLKNCTSSSFMLRRADIEEAHLVVRNSSTKELFGFCATYFVKSSQTGHIGALIVDPARRKLSIGHSLHDRAIRALLQKKEVKKFQLGSRLPNVYSGVPKENANSLGKLQQWFAKLGWTVATAAPVYNLVIRDLTTWSPPDGLGHALASADVKYDLVHGIDYAGPVLEHVQSSLRQDVYEMYSIALENKDGCGIIRAKRASDGALLGSVILCRGDSKLAAYLPGFGKQTGRGLISSLVISQNAVDKNALVQGLVLLGVRQLRRQGARSIVLDYVSKADARVHTKYADTSRLMTR